MNSRLSTNTNESTPLEELFRSHLDREWNFVKPGGNWGDNLIYAGAEALAQRLGLEWRDHDFRNFDPSKFPAGSAIYLHGGGGFNPWGSRRAFSNLKKALSVPEALVVQGPQTADITSDLTAGLFRETLQDTRTENLYFYAREDNTLAFLKATLPAFSAIGLDRDTALHLTKADVLNLAGLPSVPGGRYHLLVSREDDEAPNNQSRRGKGIVKMDPAYFAGSFAHWIRIHAFAKGITSNRLHSAIVGALLEKPVVLMAGSYHKNRSIWEYSLKHRGVCWREEEPSPNVENGLHSSPWNFMRRSWKVRRAAMWLNGVPLR